MMQFLPFVDDKALARCDTFKRGVCRLADCFCSVMMLLVASTSVFGAACDGDLMPTPEQQADETASRPNEELENGCMAQATARVSLRGTTLNNPSFSHSPKWGDVLRMDIGQPRPE